MTETSLNLTKSVSIPKTSSDCITFRIPVEKMNRLGRESEAKGVSLNTSINQIISEYLNWHRMAAPAKLYYLPKPFLIRIIEELNDEELGELARETAKSDLVDISLFLRGRFTVASLSNITETWLRISQMSHRIQIDGDKCTIIIEHDMGHKYSYLIKEISRYILEVAFGAQTSCDITDNSVMIMIKKSW